MEARMFDQDGNLTECEMPDEMRAQAEEINNNLSEIVAETDDALMESFSAAKNSRRKKSSEDLKLRLIIVHALRYCLAPPMKISALKS